MCGDFTEKLEPTKIVQKPANKDVKEGTKVKFESTVKGKPLPEVSWFKNEVKLEPTDRITIDTKEVIKGKWKIIVQCQKY